MVPASTRCVPSGSVTVSSAYGTESTRPVTVSVSGASTSMRTVSSTRTAVCSRKTAGASNRARGGAVAQPGSDQEEHRHQQRGELEPVLEGLDEGDAAHAARRDRAGDDDGDDEPADPFGRAGEDLQRQARPLELRQQVEPADADDEQAGQTPHPGRFEAGLGEVGERVRAGAAQRGGDEDQQHQVSGGVTDGVPQHVGALEQDEPGDAEEGGGGEVFAADGGGVEAGPHGAGGDVEVGGGAGDAQAEGADEHGGEDDDGDGGHRVGLVHVRSSTPVSGLPPVR